MRVFRIADRRHAIWDGTGAMLVGGRWNDAGHPVIYASLSYAGAMLEILVHARIGKLPVTHEYVSAEIPDDVSVETLGAADFSHHWDAPEFGLAPQYGNRWLKERRSAVLLVPSVVAREEWNVLVNPIHPHAQRIVVSEPKSVVWDTRLFRRGVPVA